MATAIAPCAHPDSRDPPSGEEEPKRPSWQHPGNTRPRTGWQRPHSGDSMSGRLSSLEVQTGAAAHRARRPQPRPRAVVRGALDHDRVVEGEPPIAHRATAIRGANQVREQRLVAACATTPRLSARPSAGPPAHCPSLMIIARGWVLSSLARVRACARGIAARVSDQAHRRGRPTVTPSCGRRSPGVWSARPSSLDAYS